MIVTGLSLFLFGGHTTSIDEETYLAGLRSLLHLRTGIDTVITPTEILVTNTGRGGVPTSIYGLGTSLFYLPMYVLGKLFSYVVASAWREQVLRLFVFSTNSFALGLTASVIFLTARHMRCSVNSSLGGAFAYGVGSYALAAAGTGFSETITAMFLVTCLYLLVTRARYEVRGAFLSALALGGAFLMRPSALIFAPVIMFNLFVTSQDQKSRSLGYFTIGLAGPVCLMLAYNYWKWTDAFDTGYPKLAYDTPWYEGLYGLFFSSGKGLIWFAPITLVSLVFIRQAFLRNKTDTFTIWLLILVNAALFCRFEVWSGDDAYGPRYMTIVLPLLALVAVLGASEVNPRAIWISGLFGLPAAAAGSLIYVNASNFSRLKSILDVVGSNSRRPDGSYDWTRTRRSVNFIPRLSQLIEHLESIPRAAAESWRSLTTHSAPFAVDTKQSLAWYASRVRLDVWWLYWIESSAPLLVLSLVLIPILSITIGVKLLRDTWNEFHSA